MLAYYVIWHMKRDLAPMLFKDDNPAAAAAQRSLINAPLEHRVGRTAIIRGRPERPVCASCGPSDRIDGEQL
jgi:hypothetical protein